MNLIPHSIYSLVSRAKSMARMPLAKRADNPYATHVPILVGIGQLLKVKRVLELGCGQYSTLTFLNRTIFSELEQLHSVENNSIWANKVVSLVNTDPRFQLTYIDEPMSSIINKIPITDYDLLFIDDSQDSWARSETIKVVSKYTSALSVVVIIHDFEIKAYRDSAEGFINTFRFTALNPNTGVLWNNFTLQKQKLKRLNSVIKKTSPNMALEDLYDWLEVLRPIVQ